MSAADLDQQASPADTSPTCAYWRRLAIDTLLGLAAAREELARHDEDFVELIASDCFRAYRLLGGTELELGTFRARIRTNEL